MQNKHQTISKIVKNVAQIIFMSLVMDEYIEQISFRRSSHNYKSFVKSVERAYTCARRQASWRHYVSNMLMVIVCTFLSEYLMWRIARYFGVTKISAIPEYAIGNVTNLSKPYCNFEGKLLYRKKVILTMSDNSEIISYGIGTLTEKCVAQTEVRFGHNYQRDIIKHIKEEKGIIPFHCHDFAFKNFGFKKRGDIWELDIVT